MIGRCAANGELDFGSIAAIEVKRIVATARDELKESSFGTTQAAGLKAFGFDKILLLHLIDRERRADGYLSPFPQGDRSGFISRLHSLLRPHLDGSYGYLPLLWAHEDNAYGEMRGGGPGWDLNVCIPPPERPQTTKTSEYARKKLVEWLKAQPERVIWAGFLLLGSECD